MSRGVRLWRRRNCGAPLSGGRCLGHKTVPKKERGAGRFDAGASSCAGLIGVVVSSGSDGTQEHQRHSRSVRSLGGVHISGAARGLRFCVLGVYGVGDSSKSRVAGKERLSARVAAKLRRRRGGVSAAVCVRQREQSAGRQ